MKALSGSIRLLILFASVIFLFASNACADKSYRIAEVRIESVIGPDGALQVRENRTYDFEGRYRYAFRTFPISSRARFEQFKVYEGETPYIFSNRKEPGSFTITRDDDNIKVEWYFIAKDEKRTFSISFIVHGALIRYDDTAELNYQFISTEWSKSSNDVWVSVTPPEDISKAQVNAWLHGPLWGAYRIEENGSIIAWCEKLPKHRLFEIHALYPPELFPDAPYKAGSMKGKIRATEAELAEKSNQMRLKAQEDEERRIARWSMGKWVAGLTGLLGLFGWFRLKSQFGRKASFPPPVEISPGIPEQESPALVDYLVRSKEVGNGALIGTLLDLARRKILVLEEVHEEKRVLGRKYISKDFKWKLNRSKWNASQKQMKSYENSLIEFLFDDLAAGQDEISLKALQKKQTKFQKFFSSWRKDVKEQGKSKEWFDQRSYKGMGYSLGLAGGMLLLVIPAAIFFGPWALLLAVAAILVFFLSFAIAHRTREGEILFRRWKALQRYLAKFHFKEERSKALDNLDSYLVYGSVLGISKKVYSELAGLIPTDRIPHYLPWYSYAAGSQDFTPDAFASAFSSMIATTTSAMSTASGTGGGASAGTSGGVGSGGGGAG